MTSQSSSRGIARVLEWILGVIGAMNCVAVPILVVPDQRELFPLPDLYFIEIASLGMLSIAAVVIQTDDYTRWTVAPWISAGVLATFVILGGFSIGFFLIPAAIAFLLTGILMDWRFGGDIGRHAGLAAVSAVVQAALMLSAILLGQPPSIP